MGLMNQAAQAMDDGVTQEVRPAGRNRRPPVLTRARRPVSLSAGDRRRLLRDTPFANQWWTFPNGAAPDGAP